MRLVIRCDGGSSGVGLLDEDLMSPMREKFVEWKKDGYVKQWTERA